MEEKELYYTNGYGIKIKKCCASCSHMQPDNKTRICMRGEGIVAPTSYCLDWELRKGLENGGKGGGKVKKGDYLQYCLGVLEEDNAKAIEYAQKGLVFKRRMLFDIRDCYEKKYGEIISL